MKIHEFLKIFLRKAAAAAPLPRLYYKICYRAAAAPRWFLKKICREPLPRQRQRQRRGGHL
jgi:hypothetical protein